MEASKQLEIRQLIDDSLSHCDDVWREVGVFIRASQFSAMESSESRETVLKNIRTPIPNYPIIEWDKPIVADFIAIVVDMIASTANWKSRFNGPVSGFKRLYYETSALLPAMAHTIDQYGGAVTEYLGDGVLGLFNASEDTLGADTKNARAAALDCLLVNRTIVNPLLKKKYPTLPDIGIRIGLSYSQALIQLVGLRDQFVQPKAIGECVWYASKLAKEGANQVYMDKEMFDSVPQTKGGFSWTPKFLHGRNAYLVS